MSNLLSIVLDVPVIFALLFYSISGWKKGAVRPFINFLGSLISTSVSVFISIPISKKIYALIKNFLLNKLHLLCVNQKIEKFPRILIFIFKLCKINENKLSKIMFEENPESILLGILSPIIVNFVRIVVGSILFFVIMSIVRKISKVSNSIFKAPVLLQINSALGSFFGFLKGALISWVCVSLIKVSLIYWTNPPKIFAQNSIDSSFVFEKFYSFNPITNKFMNDISDTCELGFLKWDLNQRREK